MFQVSDALLPLLDVAMLLLGLFMILMAVQASDNDDGGETGTDQQVATLPGNIFLIEIEKDGEVWLTQRGDRSIVPNGAKNLVRQIGALSDKNDNNYAVLFVNDPAGRRSSDVYRQCAMELARNNIRFARGQN
jgi:biopolymer transport protein ExbD